MLLSEFDYHLPEELIAQHPLPERDASRMLIVERSSGQRRDASFRVLADELPPGTLLVLNNVKVFPARLIGKLAGRTSPAEALLVREVDAGVWEALVRPGRIIRNGTQFRFGDEPFHAEVVGHLGEGRRLLKFEPNGERLRILIEKHGRMPLPPYIRRTAAAVSTEDQERYQTIFARNSGAIAAPTAGLHFTRRTFAELMSRNIEHTEITHYVGYGTFQPVRCQRIEDHRMERERYEITPGAAERLNRAKREGRPVFAVGTTVVRALESAASESGRVEAGVRETDLFIFPPYRFRLIDGLLTNFHLPQSTLLMLVCAFADRDLILKAYGHAIESRYRFYSYGDCMLIR